ncbi:MAG: hypothetical protein R3B84_02265 [Zavarzinella sp.]
MKLQRMVKLANRCLEISVDFLTWQLTKWNTPLGFVARHGAVYFFIIGIGIGFIAIKLIWPQSYTILVIVANVLFSIVDPVGVILFYLGFELIVPFHHLYTFIASDLLYLTLIWSVIVFRRRRHRTQLTHNK